MHEHFLAFLKISSLWFFLALFDLTQQTKEATQWGWFSHNKESLVRANSQFVMGRLVHQANSSHLVWM